MTRTDGAIAALLVLATALEASGDAIVRIGLGHAGTTRLLCFAGGALLLFGYAFALNSAPIEFERVVGLYVATLFVMWQVISFATFRTIPTVPVLVGGALIVAGGMIVTLWPTAPAA